MDFLCPDADICPLASLDAQDLEINMNDLVDIALPANAQQAAEMLGLKVHRSVTTGARVRQIPRDDAEIAIECLRDWGISARIVDSMPEGEGPAPGDIKRAA